MQVWGMIENQEYENTTCERCNEHECICGDHAFEQWLIDELDELEKERENESSK
jgi:hypothetical protein